MVETLSVLPTTVFSTFALIGLAEFGDKSQLVCMALAARYRGWPVLLGAIAAFMLLNLIAVLFGAALAQWLPELLLTLLVGGLFVGFGAHALYSASDDPGEVIEERGGHGIFFSTFLLIMLAELGDKTKIAVAGLASTASAQAVSIGATLALLITSGLGVWAGRTLMQRMSLGLVHRLSGGLFILFGLGAWASLLW